jgi:hypothetical protein
LVEDFYDVINEVASQKLITMENFFAAKPLKITSQEINLHKNVLIADASLAAQRH